MNIRKLNWLFYLFSLSIQYIKLRNSWFVSRRPRMWSFDFRTNMTFPSMSRLRGNNSPWCIYSIFKFASHKSNIYRNERIFIAFSKMSKCKIDFCFLRTYHLHRILFSIHTFPRAYSTMLQDLNLVALKIVEAKYLSIWYDRCLLDGNHLHAQTRTNIHRFSWRNFHILTFVIDLLFSIHSSLKLKFYLITDLIARVRVPHTKTVLQLTNKSTTFTFTGEWL